MLINISTQQLEYLVEAASAPTWAEAASRLGVTQSALSQGLSQLERRLAVPLFDRDGRRRVLRANAAPVLQFARAVVAQTRDLGRWADAVQGAERGAIRVGMIDLAAIVHFGSTLQQFRRDRPGVELHLAVGPSAALSEQLAAGELSLAVIVEPAVNTGDFDFTPLLTDKLAVYGPEGMSAPVEEWGPWVTFPTGSHTRGLVARRLEELGATFEVVAESHQPEVLRGMVALGMGWTVLPVLQAEAEPNPLVPATAEPVLERRLVAARRTISIDDPITDQLLAELERVAKI